MPRTWTTAELAERFDCSYGHALKAMEGLKPVGKRGRAFLWSSEQARQFERALGPRIKAKRAAS